MNDETAKEIVAHLASVNRQLTAIKWLLRVVAVIIGVGLLWFASHPPTLSVAHHGLPGWE